MQNYVYRFKLKRFFCKHSINLLKTSQIKKPCSMQGFLGWLIGLEPTTLGTTNRCSNQLSYSHRVFYWACKSNQHFYKTKKIYFSGATITLSTSNGSIISIKSVGLFLFTFINLILDLKLLVFPF